MLKVLNGRCQFTTCDGVVHTICDRWDLIIAFPPCTHLATSGARHFAKKRDDGRQLEGITFFAKMLEADCDKIAVENPVNIIGGNYIEQWFPQFSYLPKHTQVIHPWQYGHNAEKTTWLWLKGLPTLKPYTIEKPELEYWVGPTGRKMEKWMYEIRCKPVEQRAKLASKTFPGIAEAMAEQWG